MLKHLVISVVFFFTTLYFSYLQSGISSAKISSIKNKIYNAFTSFVFIQELLLFFFGCFIVCLYFAIGAYLSEKGLRDIFKGKANSLILTILVWLMLIIITFGISYKIHPNLALSSPAWNNSFFIYSSIFILFFSIIFSLKVKKNLILFFSALVPIISLEIIGDLGSQHDIKKSGKPNVFIIGIDSFNTDKISEDLTPFIYSFVNSSSYFPNSYTHIARTYPSWYSILSGKHPLTSNVRLNLTDYKKSELLNSLPAYLKSKGYVNLYIQDERRFNNINEDFYFDHVIGPPASAAEFMLSNLANSPQLSLAVHLKQFELFMPHLLNNRGVWATYSADLFLDEVDSKLSTLETKGGVFIGSHFTLPHWPYKDSSIESTALPLYERYLLSLQNVDRQVANYFKSLRNRGLLDNAIVFLISDHGESFAREEDIPYFKFNFPINLAGHGTNIASKTQIKTLFSYQVFGNSMHSDCHKELGVNQSNVVLSDIFPTIVYCLGYEDEISNLQLDGLPVVTKLENRVIPIESSLQPLFNSTGEVDLNGTIKQYSSLYTVNKNGRVIVRDELYEKAIASKQKGIIINEWSLLFYPELENTAFIVNFSNNSGEKYENFPNMEIKNKLYYEFCRYYETDLAIHSSGFCGNLSLADTKSMIYE